jgi:integrase
MSAYAERRKGKLTGCWIGETVIGGDRFRKRFQTRREAERWADFVKISGTVPAEDGSSSGPTFEAVINEMKETNGPGRDHSAGQRLEFVRDMLGPLTPIKTISTLMLDRVVADLKKRPGIKGKKLSTATINRYLAAASGVLKYAKERGYIEAIPVVPWQKEGGKRIHWLTEEQEETMAAQMTPECAMALRVLVASGMRWGEFESLEPEQIDIRNDNAWVRLWKTKSDRPRSVPIPVELGRELRAAVAARTLPTYYTMITSVRRFAKSAGQSEGFCIHSLRHTTATRLIQRGVNLAVVQRFLGHNDIKTTLRYTQIVDDDLANAADKLSQHAGQTAPERELALS